MLPRKCLSLRSLNFREVAFYNMVMRSIIIEFQRLNTVYGIFERVQPCNRINQSKNKLGSDPNDV